MRSDLCAQAVLAGLDPAIHAAPFPRALRRVKQRLGGTKLFVLANRSRHFDALNAWMAGSSPARTWEPQRKNSLNNSYRYKSQTFGSYSVICWYGPFPIALIQLGGSSLSPQASRARRQPR